MAPKARHQISGGEAVLPKSLRNGHREDMTALDRRLKQIRGIGRRAWICARDAGRTFGSRKTGRGANAVFL